MGGGNQLGKEIQKIQLLIISTPFCISSFAHNTLVRFTDDGKFGKNIIFYSRRSHLPLICNQVLQSQHTHEKPRYFLIWSKNYWLSLAFRSLFTIYFYTYACQERLCSQNLYPSTIVKQYSISTLHYKFKYLLQKKNLIFMVEWYERAKIYL